MKYLPLQNASFESWSGPKLDNWDIETTDLWSIDKESFTVIDKGYALKLTYGPAPSKIIVKQEVNLEVGETYKISGWVYVFREPSNEPLSHKLLCQYAVMFIDNSDFEWINIPAELFQWTRFEGEIVAKSSKAIFMFGQTNKMLGNNHTVWDAFCE